MDTTRLQSISLVGFDVDGVLTEGQKFYCSELHSCKVFDVRDGLGVFMLVKSGLTVALVSNDNQELVRLRAEDLHVSEIYLGIENKGAVIRQLQKKYKVSKDNTLFMGDDVWDLPAFDQAGICVAVPEAVDAVLAKADWITRRSGGRGAVREVVDALLEAKGQDPLDLLGLR